jgi:hypothetical protein
MMRACNTELALNDRHGTACKRHAGAARSADKWGLARQQDAYKATGTGLAALALQRELNALKQTALSWLDAVSTCAPHEALRNLDLACAHCFRRCQLKQEGKWKGKVGYPPPNTQKRGRGSLRLTGSLVVVADALQGPRRGRVRRKEHGSLPVTGTAGVGVTVLSATVSEQAGHW